MGRMIKHLIVFTLLSSSSVMATGYSEQMLKQLFTKPSERQGLNATRRGGQSSDFYVSGPSSVQVNGIVSRSDGKSVVWVNGKNTMNNSMVDGVKVYSNEMKKNNKIPVRVDGRMVYVKPGETWSEETGVVDDNY